MTDKTETHFCTAAEAQALIKKAYTKGISYYVWCSTFLYTQQPDENDEGARGFSDIRAILPVSQRDALKMAAELLGEVFEKKGARLKVQVVDTTYGSRHVYIG